MLLDDLNLYDHPIHAGWMGFFCWRLSRQLADSPLFEQLKRREQLARVPSLAVIREHPVPILLLATVSAFQVMDSNVTGTYAISFMRFAGIPLATTATIIFLSRVGDVLGVLLSGPLTDLCKRRIVAYLAISLTTLLSYPSSGLQSCPNPVTPTPSLASGVGENSGVELWCKQAEERSFVKSTRELTTAQYHRHDNCVRGNMRLPRANID